jgi:hypothetical protein
VRADVPGRPHYAAQAFGERPYDQRQCLAGLLQAAQGARITRRLARQQRAGEVVDIEARHVHDGRTDCRILQRSGRKQQRKLLDLLEGGEQIALGALGKQHQALL